MTQPWWQEFFQGLPVELWMGMCAPDGDRAEAEFIEKAQSLPPGGRVLDVPTGHGRHACELAARGFRVTGVDLSAEFLGAAQSRAGDRGVDVRWEQRDMRDLPWTAEFDGAFCFGNSFGYLEHEENVVFVQAVGRALKPGGRFLIDSGLVAESVLPNYQGRGWYDVGGIHMLIENSYDTSKGRLETQYTFIKGAQVERRDGSQQVYTLRELCELLAGAGFDGFEAYSSIDRTPFALGAQRLLLLAVRR